jgi:hypothetical protein
MAIPALTRLLHDLAEAKGRSPYEEALLDELTAIAWLASDQYDALPERLLPARKLAIDGSAYTDRFEPLRAQVAAAIRMLVSPQGDADRFADEARLRRLTCPLPNCPNKRRR